MTFLQFAFNNVKRNTRMYLTYFFSSVFSITLFFMYAAFASHPSFSASSIGVIDVSKWMSGGKYVIYVLSFLFIIYSVNSFIRERKKEFGVLSILGATPLQVTCLVIFENMILGTVAIVTGISTGLLLEKVFFMFIATIIDTKAPAFYFPGQAMGLTASSFILLFVLVSMFLSIRLSRMNVLNLLLEVKKPGEEPRASIVLSVLAVAFLGFSYYGFLVNKLEGQRVEAYAFKCVWLMVPLTIGTYFLFSQLSVYLAHWLKTRKNYYWKGTRILWLSDLSSHLRDSARFLFMVTILLVFVLSSYNGFLLVKKHEDDSLLKYPFSFYLTYSHDKTRDRNQVVSVINKKLEEEGISYEKVPFSLLYTPFLSKRGGNLIRLSEYNRLAHFLGLKQEQLATREVISLSANPELLSDKEMGVGDRKLNIIKNVELSIQLNTPYCYVITDSLYEEISRDTKKSGIRTFINYFIPKWYKDQSKKSRSELIRVGQEIESTVRHDFPEISFFSKGREYVNVKQTLDTVSVVVGFIVLQFALAAAGLIFSRVMSKMEKKIELYRSLSKMGITETEIKRTENTQIIIIFFLPFLVAIPHTLIILEGFSKIHPHLRYSSIIPAATAGIGCLFAVTTIYFVVMIRKYSFSRFR